jgi:hypothetical protein
MEYTLIKKYKSLELVKLDTAIMGGFYALRCNKAKKAKTGLNLDAALEIFDNCIK